MHPIKSVIARRQNYISKHFEKSKYGKELAKLKNSAVGDKCFIIGNGPSLTADDLTTLHNNNIPCFASNNILKMFDKTIWRPTYYVCEDLLVLQDLQEKINNTELNIKIAPVNYHWFLDGNIVDAKYYFQVFSDTEKFSDDIAKHIIGKGTVTTTCMQIATYMGYKKIYLLGIDHNYRKFINNSGVITENKSIRDYFDDNYAKTMEKKMIPNLEATTQAYEEVREHCNTIGVQIFNATRGGKLEVYPRADFDSLFNNEV